LELETVGALVDLGPGASVEHVERWSLYRGVKMTGLNEAEIERVIGAVF